MRPRHLRLTAFGPFADTVEVDFDRLADTGLFVVAGPTGAGKTSLFDGVCFALYGRLAGHRDGHGDVRSDHAAPDRPTEVQLVFDAAGDRWRVWRRPRQERPKRRGTGTTVDPPEARLERWHDGRWHPAETRWEPVTQRCRLLVGLDADQFQQVVLLPQGRFQAVLNARSTDRQALLRTLFRSQLYRRGQDALELMARQVAHTLDTIDQQRRSHLTAAQQALDAAAAALLAHQVPLGDAAPAPVDPDQADASLALVDAVDRLAAGPIAELHRARARAEDRAASDAERAARATQLVALIERRRELEAAWRGSEAEAADRCRQRATVDLARRATPVADAHAVATSCRIELDQARLRQHEAWQAASAACQAAGIDLPVEPDEDAAEQARVDAELRAKELADLATVRRSADRADADAAQLDDEVAALERLRAELLARRAADRSRLAELDDEREAVAPVAADHPSRAAALAEASRRAELVDRLAEVTRSLTELDAGRDAVDEELGCLDDQLETTSDAHTAAAATAGDLGAARAALVEAERCLDRRRAVDAGEEELVDAEAAVAAARAAADAAVARFVAGAAPRLAAGLAPGSPCPVCGSSEHPAPATGALAGDLVDVPDLERSSRSAAEAEGRRSAAVATLAGLRAELGPLVDRPVEVLRHAIDTARHRLDTCTSAADQAATLERRLAELRRRVDDARRRRAAIQEQIEAVTSSRGELVGALGDDRGTDRAGQQAAVELARRHLAEADAAVAQLRELATERAAVAQRTGEVSAELEALADRCARRAEQAAAARRRAADLRAEVAAELGEADLDDLAGRTQHAAQAAARARRRVADRAEAERALAAASCRVRAAVAAGRFPTRDVALAAVRDPAEVARLDRDVRAWEQRRHETRAALAALSAHDLPAEAPDVAELAERAARSAERAAELIELAGEVAAQLGHARRALDDVAALDQRTAATQAQARVVRSAAEVVRGRNARNVTLEAWVLAAHLREVVAHANHHLAAMSSGRYQLAVTDTVLDARARSGLDLVVEDAFTGVARPTVSLSGGETFQAALALALGLADVVTAGQAGLRLDALFIDEGFGSLDADALDQAIDVLDGLRTRGALVGVVTHVESLKNALPVAIEVRPRPDRRGSTVHQAA